MRWPASGARPARKRLRGFIAESIARRRLSELGHGHDVSGVRFGNFFKRLALHNVKRAEPLLRVFGDIIDVASDLTLPE